jgi:hypothetical protein
VLENKVLRILGPKADVVAGSWRRMHNEELHNLYTSPNIIKEVKSKKMTGAGHLACMGQMRMHTKFWLEGLKGRDHSEDLGIDGKIILEWILRK